eukprot:439946-Rhodomonas_salina.5
MSVPDTDLAPSRCQYRTQTYYPMSVPDTDLAPMSVPDIAERVRRTIGGCYTMHRIARVGLYQHTLCQYRASHSEFLGAYQLLYVLALLAKLHLLALYRLVAA